MSEVTSMGAFRRARDYQVLDRAIAQSRLNQPLGRAEFSAFFCAVRNLGFSDSTVSTYAQAPQQAIEQWRRGENLPDYTQRRNAVLYMRSLANPNLRRDC